MKLIETLADIKTPFANAVITIGNFDGVHIGHQALFHTVMEKADAIGGTSVAMTFEPHPIRVLKPNSHPPLITLYEQKVELIARTGIDVLISVPFDQDFAALGAKAFVYDLLLDTIGVKAIVVGRDYTFGRNREGNVATLQEMAAGGGFEVIVADWIQAQNGHRERISSTNIRTAVHAGDMQLAKKMLGRYYQIRGRVAHGRNRGGKLLGFPTANINLQDELCPQAGIYAVTVEHADKTLPGVANIGYSPTFDDHIFTVEVHLLDFDQDIYNRRIKVNFVKRLREERKFDSLEALSAQIGKDVAAARIILAEVMG
ncbi:MAG: bifunctional riboflavin kinase/FAD synthetase [Desulfosarcinaceae bacterium]